MAPRATAHCVVAGGGVLLMWVQICSTFPPPLVRRHWNRTLRPIVSGRKGVIQQVHQHVTSAPWLRRPVVGAATPRGSPEVARSLGAVD